MHCNYHDILTVFEALTFNESNVFSNTVFVKFKEDKKMFSLYFAITATDVKTCQRLSF
jgi:hypothetical protein